MNIRAERVIIVPGGRALVTTWVSNDFIVHKNMALPDGLLSCQTAPIAIAAWSQAEGCSYWLL